MSEQLLGKIKAAVTAESQQFSIAELGRQRASRACNDLFPCIQAIPLSQGTPGTVAGHGEYFANYLGNYTNQRRHGLALITAAGIYRHIC
ncbi:hypothetical protein B9K09_08475 [Pseudomonas sp. M30-35]|nr:hypothetical protein B9K09_08475 [Pseudomonas sp. M30-35]